MIVIIFSKGKPNENHGDSYDGVEPNQNSSPDCVNIAAPTKATARIRAVVNRGIMATCAKCIIGEKWLRGWGS